VIGREAAVRNTLRVQLHKVMIATKAAIDEQASDGAVDAGG
jgi:hypothetical protein